VAGSYYFIASYNFLHFVLLPHLPVVSWELCPPHVQAAYGNSTDLTSGTAKSGCCWRCKHSTKLYWVEAWSSFCCSSLSSLV